MKYKKIRLNFKRCQDNRFYRTLLVKEDLNLFNLGCAIVTAFGGSFEHHFLFRTNDVNYCPKVYINSLNGIVNVLMDKYCVNDLNDRFSFIYDFDSHWIFDGEVLEEVELEQKKEVILLDGKGQGIWEDRIKTLYAYFEGKLDPDSLDEDEENKFFKPWNKKLTKFGDFDTAFDLDYEKEMFFASYKCDLEMYKEQIDKIFGINRYAYT